MRIKTIKLAAAIAAASTGTAAYAVCPAHPNVFDNGASAVAGLDRECVINTSASSEITTALTIDASNLFVLENKVEVGVAITSPGLPGGGFNISEITTANANATTLTIDAGATIIGDNTLGAAVDYLVINRGSDIFVNGTEADPVRMTSRQDISGGTAARAQWGGLYLNGYGQTNECDDVLLPGVASGTCERDGEADTGRYGGNNNADSSGSISYLTVAYAGNAFDPATDLNGIAFQAVGDATTVENIQVHQNFDDGVEFYGGAVNVKNVVLTENGDDSFDSTGGWQGAAQFVIITQTPASASGDRAFESDNNKSPNDASPETNAKVANVTIVSTKATSSDGFKIRRGSNLTIANAVIDKDNGTCFDITDSDGNGNLNAPLLSVLADCADSVTDAAASNTWVFTNNAGEVSVGATSLNGYINSISETAETATDVTLLDPFFTAVDYIGAVEDCDNDWAASWTIPGTLPVVDTSPAACVTPAVSGNVPVMGWAGMLILAGGLAGISRLARRVK